MRLRADLAQVLRQAPSGKNPGDPRGAASGRPAPDEARGATAGALRSLRSLRPRARRAQPARTPCQGVPDAGPSRHPGTRARKVSTFRIPFVSTFRVPSAPMEEAPRPPLLDRGREVPRHLSRGGGPSRISSTGLSGPGREEPRRPAGERGEAGLPVEREARRPGAGESGATGATGAPRPSALTGLGAPPRRSGPRLGSSWHPGTRARKCHFPDPVRAHFSRSIDRRRGTIPGAGRRGARGLPRRFAERIGRGGGRRQRAAAPQVIC